MRYVTQITRGWAKGKQTVTQAFRAFDTDPETGEHRSTILYPTREALDLAIEQGTVEWRREPLFGKEKRNA